MARSDPTLLDPVLAAMAAAETEYEIDERGSHILVRISVPADAWLDLMVAALDEQKQAERAMLR
jgi:hypothetical protein